MQCPVVLGAVLGMIMPLLCFHSCPVLDLLVMPILPHVPATEARKATQLATCRQRPESFDWMPVDYLETVVSDTSQVGALRIRMFNMSRTP